MDQDNTKDGETAPHQHQHQQQNASSATQRKASGPAAAQHPDSPPSLKPKTSAQPPTAAADAAWEEVDDEVIILTSAPRLVEKKKHAGTEVAGGQSVGQPKERADGEAGQQHRTVDEKGENGKGMAVTARTEEEAVALPGGGGTWAVGEGCRGGKSIAHLWRDRCRVLERQKEEAVARSKELEKGRIDQTRVAYLWRDRCHVMEREKEEAVARSKKLDGQVAQLEREKANTMLRCKELEASVRGLEEKLQQQEQQTVRTPLGPSFSSAPPSSPQDCLEAENERLRARVAELQQSYAMLVRSMAIQQGAVDASSSSLSSGGKRKKEEADMPKPQTTVATVVSVPVTAVEGGGGGGGVSIAGGAAMVAGGGGGGAVLALPAGAGVLPLPPRIPFYARDSLEELQTLCLHKKTRKRIHAEVSSGAAGGGLQSDASTSPPQSMPAPLATSVPGASSSSVLSSPDRGMQSPPSQPAQDSAAVAAASTNKAPVFPPSAVLTARAHTPPLPALPTSPAASAPTMTVAQALEAVMQAAPRPAVPSSTTTNSTSSNPATTSGKKAGATPGARVSL